MKLTFFVVESVGNFPPNGWYQFKMDSPKHVNTKDVARLKANSLLWLLTNDIPGPRSFHFFGQPQSRKPSSTAAEENQTSRHRIKVTGYLPAEFGQILLLGNLLFFDGFLLVGWLVLQKCQTQIRKKHTVWRLQSSMIALGCQANAWNKFYNIFLQAFSICQVWFVPIEWSASWWTQILGWDASI